MQNGHLLAARLGYLILQRSHVLGQSHFASRTRQRASRSGGAKGCRRWELGFDVQVLQRDRCGLLRHCVPLLEVRRSLLQGGGRLESCGVQLLLKLLHPSLQGCELLLALDDGILHPLLGAADALGSSRLQVCTVLQLLRHVPQTTLQAFCSGMLVFHSLRLSCNRPPSSVQLAPHRMLHHHALLQLPLQRHALPSQLLLPALAVAQLARHLVHLVLRVGCGPAQVLALVLPQLQLVRCEMQLPPQVVSLLLEQRLFEVARCQPVLGVAALLL